jgi:glucosamine 6-phosphate synthetase-like amidotransferase/phosphosugar isomerase protein
MKHHKTIGDYYAHLLQQHLHAAMQKKLDETSALKKILAGIETLQDAQTKGYAPNNEQISQMKDCIKHHANTKYSHVHFRALGKQQAIAEFVEAVIQELAVLNTKWHKARQFSFDKSGLKDLTEEAIALISSEHDAACKHFINS